LFLDGRGELRWETFEYFPRAHYELAVDEALQDESLVSDGGRRTQYYWVGDEGILYHTSEGEDRVDPFFDTVDDAEQFLETQAQQYGEDRYEAMVLRKTGNRKVMEAVEVLTQQTGVTDW
jgi:hypothetical protein